MVKSDPEQFELWWQLANVAGDPKYSEKLGKKKMQKMEFVWVTCMVRAFYYGKPEDKMIHLLYYLSNTKHLGVDALVKELNYTEFTDPKYKDILDTILEKLHEQSLNTVQ